MFIQLGLLLKIESGEKSYILQLSFGRLFLSSFSRNSRKLTGPVGVFKLQEEGKQHTL